MNNNKKYKSLYSDIKLYTISSLGHKVLAFLLVPLYTTYMTTSEYGKVDLVNTIIALIVPIFTLNVNGAVLRFTLSDNKDNRFLSQGVYIDIKGTSLLLFLSIISWNIPLFSKYKEIIIWILIIFILNVTYIMQQSYLRAIERLRIIVVASLCNSFAMLIANVIFISKYKMGARGYFIGIIIGFLSAVIFMELSGNILKKIDIKNKLPQKEYTEMLKYCRPTVITGIAWWINSGLDRFFVTTQCGIDQNGIYSVAGKIPAIMSIVNGIFGKAWSVTAIKEFDAEDKDGFFGNIYELYQASLLFICSCLIFFNIQLSKILYAKDFFGAWHYVPFLLISSLYSALSGFWGGIFSAQKKMKTMAYITIISALINVVLNMLLIPKYKVQGAAIATMLSYFIAWLIRYCVSKKYIRIRNNVHRELLAYCIIFTQAVFSLGETHAYSVQFLLMTILIVMYFPIYKKTIIKAIKSKSRITF